MKNLAKTYNPKDFEDRIYEMWEDKGAFNADIDKDKKPFTIVMPPPNITGQLHMGHALDQTLQDILTRWKRLQGYSALWLPGSDHASIATEVKVVEKLRNEKGIDKHDLSREEFLEHAWEWKREYGGRITRQCRKLGDSCDWRRERFTMDEGCNRAVNEMFIRLYKEGLIYKGDRIINWCPSCETTLSDAEVEHEDLDGHYWYFRYPAADGSEGITIATSRPETMFADVAIAVAEGDERYAHLVGKTVILPLVGREIPVITDEHADPEFGTGAVKVTPAHDMNDYQAGLDHNLEIIEVFDENLIMNNLCEEFSGMNIYEAREKIVKKLETLGDLVKIEDYTHNVAKCDRCHSTIEPRISDQWFVKMKDLAEPAIEAVRKDDIKFIPKRYEKTYFNWMENLKDWCISRQIWWGHQMPVYYCKNCNEINVELGKPEKCKKCGCKDLVQDEDTLDTWFSSALWPFSTLGWPEKDAIDLKTFYPTDTLVTGYDIIQAWVSRMIYSGLEYMKEKPFENVLIHGIVRDSQGRKMSKSLGNGIDPLEIIEKYGTDSLRFSLILGITAGNDIRYSQDKLDNASNFANKLWNASKFVLMNLEDYDENNGENNDDQKLQCEDKWILSKLNRLVQEVTNNIENFDLGVAVQKIYDFIWNEFCDWYIEIVKTRLYDKNCKTRKAAQYTLNKVLQDSLKLLHPVMPFVTEKIYMELYNNDESIMISEWPKYNAEFNFEEDEENIEKLKSIIVGIRNVRNKMNVHPSKKSKLIFVTTKYKNLIEESKGFLQKLGFASEIIIQETRENIEQNAISILESNLELFIPFEDLVDIEAEKERLASEKEKLLKEVERGEKMLSNPGFINKAPESKVKEEKEKLEKYKELLKNVEERLRGM